MADIVTVDQVKAQLNIPLTDTSQDTELEAFIASVTDVIEHITGPVTAREVIEVHDGGQPAIVLEQPPVLSITSVAEGGATLPAASWTLSSAGVLYRSSMVRYRPSGGWFGANSAVTVTYQAGRSAIPPSIAQAAKELVAINFRPQQGGNHSPFDSGSTDSVAPAGQYRLGFFIPNRVMQLLAPHVQPGGIA